MDSRINPPLYSVLLIVPAIMSGSLATARGVDAKITEFPAGFVERTYYEDIAFSPNGRTLVLVEREGLVKLCDLTTGKAEMLPKPFTGKHWSTKVAHSKGDHLLAVGYGAHGIVIWDIDAKRETCRIPLRQAGVFGMVFIDGNRTLLALLVTTKGNVLAARWEVPSGAPGRTLDFGKSPIAKILSPDGRHLILRVPLNEYAVFDVANGKRAFDLKPGGGWVFSQDGSRLISCEEGRLYIREVPSGKELRHFEVNPEFSGGYPPLPSVSSDGKLLAVQGYPGYINASVISLETGKLLDRVECGPPFSLCDIVRLSPDGRMMATQTSGVNEKDEHVGPILKLWKLPASWVGAREETKGQGPKGTSLDGKRGMGKGDIHP